MVSQILLSDSGLASRNEGGVIMNLPVDHSVTYLVSAIFVAMTIFLTPAGGLSNTSL